jgi:hypothetical protein
MVYEGTLGFRELIVRKTSSDEIFSVADMEKYIIVPTSTNALKRNNDPNEKHPKSNRSPE